MTTSISFYLGKRRGSLPTHVIKSRVGKLKKFFAPNSLQKCLPTLAWDSRRPK